MKTKIKDYILKIWNWWRHSAEDSKGLTSGRRLSAMFLTIFCYIMGRITYMLYAYGVGITLIAKSTGTDLRDDTIAVFKWLLLGHCLDIIFIGLLWGYINFQQIVELKNGKKEVKPEETKEND